MLHLPKDEVSSYAFEFFKCFYKSAEVAFKKARSAGGRGQCRQATLPKTGKTLSVNISASRKRPG